MNAETFPKNLGFLNKREWEWSAYDQGLMMAARKANGMAPPRAPRVLPPGRGSVQDHGINAGEVEPVHERTLENLHRQQLVEVRGQSDVLVLGLPYLGPYNVNSILNPILVHCLGLGYLFNMYRNMPLVKPGGVVILYHPVPGSSTRSTTRRTSTSSKRSWRRRRTPRRSSRSTKSGTRPIRGTRTCTGPRTRTTASTRSTCGTGGRTDATTPAT